MRSHAGGVSWRFLRDRFASVCSPIPIQRIRAITIGVDRVGAAVSPRPLAARVPREIGGCCRNRFARRLIGDASTDAPEREACSRRGGALTCRPGEKRSARGAHVPPRAEQKGRSSLSYTSHRCHTSKLFLCAANIQHGHQPSLRISNRRPAASGRGTPARTAQW